MRDTIGGTPDAAPEHADTPVSIAEVLRRLDSLETRFSTVEQAALIIGQQSSDSHANLKWIVGTLAGLMEVLKTLPGMGPLLRQLENSRG